MDDDYEIKPFSVILPKVSKNVKTFDGETKCMYFFSKDD